MRPIYDQEKGEFLQDLGGNLLMDSQGNLMEDMDGIALDLETGGVHESDFNDNGYDREDDEEKDKK